MALVTGCAASGIPSINKLPDPADAWMKFRLVSFMKDSPSPLSSSTAARLAQYEQEAPTKIGLWILMNHVEE